MSIINRICVATVLTFVGPGLLFCSRVVAQPETNTGPPATFRLETLRSGDSFASATRRHQLGSVLGRDVRTRVEEDAGRIVDVLTDRDGRVQAAVIEFGGFLGIGTRKIAVEWSALSFEGEGRQPVVIVEMTRNQLRVAPEFKPTEPAVVRRVAD
jgi:hypothetical protein